MRELNIAPIQYLEDLEDLDNMYESYIVAPLQQMNAHFSQLHSYFTSGARHVYSNIKDREMAEALTRNPSRFILPTNGSSPWFNGENCWSFTQIHHSHKPARFTLIISLVCLEKRGEDATN